ncbi:hypothetical protein MD484_g1296, partial [Candolleomyces efflorescens]
MCAGSGELMNSETLECETEVFLESYLPQFQLSEEVYQAIFDAGLENTQNHFQMNFPFTKEADIATSLQVIVAAVAKAGEDLGCGNCLRYSLMPNQTTISATGGSGNLEIDASLNNAEGSQALRTTDTVVCMSFKLVRTFDTVGQNRRQLVSAVVQVMNEDVRRMFMFGGPETLVQVLVSLMFADDESLGFDPNIALTSDLKRQYIYTVNGELRPRRFLTTHSIFENRARTVAGRMTRVFRVVELEGQTNVPKKGAKSMVLKDVWLDEGSKPEIQIQKELFSDIEKFAKERDWREAPSLAAFKAEPFAETMAAFAEYLEGGRYKDLFLVVRDGSTGEASKPPPPSAWLPTSKLFYSVANASQASAPAPGTQHYTGPLQAKTAHDRQLRPQSRIDQAIYRDHGSKRRSFLLFYDECTRVYCLPKMRDVFAVLRDCIIALRLMLCAGWVHRDISCNNIMAVQDPQTGQWKLKLADLEYSKKFNVNARASDPKTGTPFFMPCEILNRRYFGHDDLGSFNPHDATVSLDELSAASQPRQPILHNYLHDLEATYWTGLWIITSRVNHEPSLTWGLNIFRDTLTLLPDRLDAFMMSICDELEKCLVEDLRIIAKNFDHVRRILYASAKWIGERQLWTHKEALKTYSVAHAHLTNMFADLADSTASWGNVELEESNLSSLRCMEEVVNKDSNKAPVVPSAVQEGKEGTVQQQPNKDVKKNTKGKKKERHPQRVKAKNPDEKAGPAFGRKRSHRDDDEAFKDECEGRTRQSKRVKSNGGGRASGSAPSVPSTSARRTRSTRKMKARD